MGKDGEGFDYDDDHVFDYMDDDYDNCCDNCGAPVEECACIDCGLGLDGQCELAGSEHCDWECPNSHGPLYAGSRAWHLRHQSLPVDGCECSECLAANKKARHGLTGRAKLSGWEASNQDRMRPNG